MTELERLNKALVDAAVAYKSAAASYKVANTSSDAADAAWDAAVAEAAWDKASKDLSDYLKEQQDNG